MSNYNIVPRLSPDKAYVNCPTCEEWGHPNTPMRRDGSGECTCPLGHKLDVHALQRLQLSGKKLTMEKLAVIEQPTPSMVRITEKDGFYAYPEALAIIKQKFEGRMISTMATFFSKLCEYPDFMLIGRDDVAELRKAGINSAKDMLAMVAELKRVNEDMEAFAKMIQPMLDAAKGVG